MRVQWPTALFSLAYATNAFPPGHSFITLNVGKNKNGYFVNEDLDTQLRFRAIRIFELLHPDCVGLWLFDNSQNHRAMAADALRVSKLIKSDGGKNAPKLRDGWYTNADGQRVVQAMQKPVTGVQKGLKRHLARARAVAGSRHDR